MKIGRVAAPRLLNLIHGGVLTLRFVRLARVYACGRDGEKKPLQQSLGL